MIAAALISTLAAGSVVTCDPSDPAKCMCDGVPIGPHTWTPPSWLKSNATSIYDTTALMDGTVTPLSKYRAKATLVINVASA